MDLLLDPQLEGRGHSCVKSYEDEDGYISLGSTNEGGRDRLPVCIVSFNRFPCTVIAGGKEYREFEAIAELKDHGNRFNAFMWSVLFRVLDARTFKMILDDVYRAGKVRGRNDLRNELHTLMRQEF